MEWRKPSPGMSGAMWWHFIATNKVGMVIIMDNRIKALFRTALTCTDLWHQLGDYGILPSSELDGQLTKFVLGL